MVWNNLKKDLCPKCESGVLYKKDFSDGSFMMRCKVCIFVIMQERYEYLLATLKEDSYHVPDCEENLAQLNNL